MKRLLCALALALLLTGCTSNQDTITVGAILPMTGPASNFGELLLESIEWKLQGVEGIELILEDSQSNPAQAVTAYNNLVHTQDIDIIFTVTSSVSMTLKPLAEQDKVLLWSAAAHPKLTDNSHYILRHSNTAASDTAVIAEHITSKGYDSVGVLFQQDDWGTASADSLINLLENVFAEPIDHTSSDFKTPLLKIIDQDPEAILFVAIGPAAGTLVKQARELGYEGQIYSSNGLILTPGAISIAEPFLEGTYYNTYAENELYKEAYLNRFGADAPLLGNVGYTNVELLVQAIEETQSTDPLTLANYVKSLGTFSGRFGTVSITPQGDILIPTVVEKW